MSITKHWHVDIFRPWLLSNLWSLGQIGYFMAELVQSMTYPVVSGWRYVHNWTLKCRCLQAMALIKRVNFGADWTLHAWVSVKQVISCSQQVAHGAMSITKHWHVDVQAMALIKHMKFGADWTWYVWVSVKHDISCCQQVALWLYRIFGL